MGITMIDARDLGDVVGMLRRIADRREAEINAQPPDAENADRACVTILRAAADYHERQALSAQSDGPLPLSDTYKAAATPPEYLAGLASGKASLAGEISLLNAVIREHREAMAELLSGHDNLYRSHWAHLPTCNPEDDIAAKAARRLLAIPLNDDSSPRKGTIHHGR